MKFKMMKQLIIPMLLALTIVSNSWAGTFFAEGGVGAAFFFPTVYDGTWRQDGVQPPNFKLGDVAFRVGAGYKFNEKWSVQAHYMDFGKAGVKSRFVSDDDYEPVSGTCLKNCDTAGYYEVEDRMYGFDLTVSRYFPVGKWQPYVSLGGAIVLHELMWSSSGGGGPWQGPIKGTIPMLATGAGVCYDIICWDNMFYQGTASMQGGCIGGEYDCGWPIAKRVFMSTFNLRWEF